MDKVEELEQVLSEYKQENGELLPILLEVQKLYGYLPLDAMKKVAKYIKLSESHIYGVASFYTQFRFQPTGRTKICVCRGTACHVKGAPQILGEVERRLGIKEGESTPDLEYSLETVACVGCCALAPVMTINDEVHGGLTVKKVSKILSEMEG